MSAIAKFTNDARMKQRISDLLLILAGAGDADQPPNDQPSYADAEEMVDALAFLGALLVEADPGATTNQLMRRSADELARRTALFARDIRARNEESGTRLISTFALADEVMPKPERPS